MPGTPPGKPARLVDYTPEALADLEAIFDLIARDAGPDRALACLRRIERRCGVLDSFPRAGRVVPGTDLPLRIIGFERRVTIAYLVEARGVFIQRVLYAGRDLDPAARPPAAD